MEEETVQHYDYYEFLSGYSMPSSEDLDLMEREETTLPEEIKVDNRRFWFAGIVSAIAGAGIFTASNFGILSDALPWFIGAGVIGLGIGMVRTFKKIFSKKTLTLPKLELRRKSEKTFANAMNALGITQENKGLSKSERDKVIMGVCGGLGKNSGISSSLIRAIFIAAFAFSGGTAIFIYFALALFLPSARK